MEWTADFITGLSGSYVHATREDSDPFLLLLVCVRANPSNSRWSFQILSLAGARFDLIYRV